ncbi:amidohydrolase [Persicobacter diffluens]|uniref:Omega-amidase YafV n=1 Tax=Persicobacter diffluens TaxID=981 RepID=A0AAN4VZG4_9BACT|nr:carbon-nitrogen hydrolase [Persicobacter diffluens]
MKQDLRVTTIQTDLYWEDSAANLAKLEELLWEAELDTDLILLPEMFNSGFTMNQKMAEVMNGNTFRWMKQMAAQLKTVLAGSLMIKEGGSYYNRLIWMKPDGTYSYYDKRHLFRMGREHLAFHAGDERLVVNLKGWDICPLVCYDLRFPVWSRNVVKENGDLTYDLALYIASWPKSRMHVWNTLLAARAMENQAYIIGVNRIGEDGNDITYEGGSKSFNPKGFCIDDLGTAEKISTTTLKYEDIVNLRTKFPAYLDQDKFEIHYDLEALT